MLADSGIKILSIMQTHKISNLFIIFAALVLTNFLITNEIFAAGHTQLRVTNYKAVESEADSYFYAGLQSEDKKLKEEYLSQALEKYMLLLETDPKNTVIATHIGVIHDNLEHKKTAEDYFYRAISTTPNNPYINFYFAEYHFAQKDYQEALKYYKNAYNNGYSKFYEVNLRLGTIYERLGDIGKAKKYYTKASAIKPDFAELKNKIKSLDKVYYSKQNYE